MELTLPLEKYYQSYVDAIAEYKEANITSYDFLDAADFETLLLRVDNSRLGLNLPENYVKGTYLWLVDDGEFIGEISIRHSLTEDLLRYGGHIGYGIRCTQWNKGFGTTMLSKALPYARDTIGLVKVLLTCSDSNVASARVIEKNGGVLQDKIFNIVNGTERLTRRYWIEL